MPAAPGKSSLYLYPRQAEKLSVPGLQPEKNIKIFFARSGGGGPLPPPMCLCLWLNIVFVYWVCNWDCYCYYIYYD